MREESRRARFTLTGLFIAVAVLCVALANRAAAKVLLIGFACALAIIGVGLASSLPFILVAWLILSATWSFIDWKARRRLIERDKSIPRQNIGSEGVAAVVSAPAQISLRESDFASVPIRSKPSYQSTQAQSLLGLLGLCLLLLGEFMLLCIFVVSGIAPPNVPRPSAAQVIGSMLSWSATWFAICLAGAGGVSLLWITLTMSGLIKADQPRSAASNRANSFNVFGHGDLTRRLPPLFRWPIAN